MERLTEKTRKQKRSSIGFYFTIKFLKDYCVHTSLHGLRYIAEEGRPLSDRLIWILLCFLAAFGALITSRNIWDRYQTSPTMTVLENRNYPIENLPFPAITICDNNHVYWEKALRFQERYLKDTDNDTIESFQEMAAAMAIINFGDFDKMQKYFGANLERAKKLDNYLVNTSISDFMLEVMPSCHEFFENKCWWMNHYFNCCSLFELQKTEYGFCYTFNSELSERNMGIGNYDHGEGPDNLRPYRTSTAGRWGGLKFTINLPPEQIPPIMKDFIPGIVIVVSSPYDFPITGSDVPAVGSVQVVLSAEVTKATSQVQSLPPARRKCMYHDEGPQLGFPEYRHANCRAQCHRASAYQYCNCTPYFFPNEGNLPVCNVAGHICLSDFNDIFNYDKPQPDNPFFYDGQQGISCFCSEDCNRMEYTSDIYAVPVLNTNDSENKMIFNVHFAQSTVMLYRTDVVFGWLDLTVSLGGIAGLFMGFSLLSGAELVYYLTFRLFRLWWSERQDRKNYNISSSVYCNRSKPSNLPAFKYSTKSVLSLQRFQTNQRLRSNQLLWKHEYQKTK